LAPLGLLLTANSAQAEGVWNKMLQRLTQQEIEALYPGGGAIQPQAQAALATLDLNTVQGTAQALERFAELGYLGETTLQRLAASSDEQVAAAAGMALQAYDSTAALNALAEAARVAAANLGLAPAAVRDMVTQALNPELAAVRRYEREAEVRQQRAVEEAAQPGQDTLNAGRLRQIARAAAQETEALRSGYQRWQARERGAPQLGASKGPDLGTPDVGAVGDLGASVGRLGASVGGVGRALDSLRAKALGFARDFQAKVGDAFKATQVSAEDWANTMAGKYEDKWDEAARRLRDIFMHPTTSPWRALLIPAEIQEQGEEAVKRYALQTLKDFYAGLRPELVNWDAVRAGLMDPMQRAVESGNLAAFDNATLRLTPELIKFGQQQGVDMVAAYAAYLQQDQAAELNAQALGDLLLSDQAMQVFLTAGEQGGQALLESLQATLSKGTLTVPTPTVSAPQAAPEATLPAPRGAEGYAEGGVLPHLPGSKGRWFWGAERESEVIIPVSRVQRAQPAQVSVHNTYNIGSADAVSNAQRFARALAAHQEWELRRGGVLER